MADETLPLSLEQRTAARPHKLRTWAFPLEYHLAEPVDDKALSRALATVAARHDPLRLRLVPGIELRQRFLPAGDHFPIDVADCADEDEAERRRAAFFAEEWDLENHGPLRSLLVRVSGGSPRLLLSIHHLAWDGMSTDPFDADMWSSYEALRSGHEPALPPTRFGYRDYIRQQSDSGAGLAESQERYWDGIFQGWRPEQGFGNAVDRRRGERPGWWDGAVTGPAPTASRQNRLALTGRSLRVTPPMMWLAGAFAALWAHHHDDWVCLYWIHHGRDRAELFDLVGYFSRTIPLRLRLDPGDRFDELCRRAFHQVRSSIRQSAAPWQITRLADRVVGPPVVAPGSDTPRRPRMSRVSVNIHTPGPGETPAASPPLPDEDEPAQAVLHEPKTPHPGQFWLYVALGATPALSAEFDRRRFPDDWALARVDALHKVMTAVTEQGAGISLGDLREFVRR